MPQSTYRYRGYIIGFERKRGFLIVSISPAAPDLPILHRHSFETVTQSETHAIAEAKSRVDRVLAS
jgi:hypothetical protein